MGYGSCSVMCIPVQVRKDLISLASNTCFHTNTMSAWIEMITGLSRSAAFRKSWGRRGARNSWAFFLIVNIN